jgi:hypothetical protein
MGAVYKAFEPLSKFGASKKIEKLVAQCLQRDKEKRVASAQILANELKAIQQSLIKKRIPNWQQAVLGLDSW